MENLKPVICVGAALVDEIFTSNEMVVQGTSNPSSLHKSAGGVARNIASYLAHLGHRIELITHLGNDASGNWLMDQCIKVGHVDHLDLRGLRDDRRAVIAGGLCILYTLVTHFGITALHSAKGALRQGVIVDLHERLTPARGKRGGEDRQSTRLNSSH